MFPGVKPLLLLLRRPRMGCVVSARRSAVRLGLITGLLGAAATVSACDAILGNLSDRPTTTDAGDSGRGLMRDTGPGGDTGAGTDAQQADLGTSGFCGDRVCNGKETCETCFKDCGACVQGSDGGDARVGGGGDAHSCTQPPPDFDAATKPGVRCPFGADDGGLTPTCREGDECCVRPADSGSPSVCQMETTTCPTPGSLRIQCQGMLDCIHIGDEVCCGYGTVQTAPACSPYPPYSYVTQFDVGPSGGPGGTFCATSCTVADVNTFQLCATKDECIQGNTCAPIQPSGVLLGACIESLPPGIDGG